MNYSPFLRRIHGIDPAIVHMGRTRSRKNVRILRGSGVKNTEPRLICGQTGFGSSPRPHRRRCGTQRFACSFLPHALFRVNILRCDSRPSESHIRRRITLQIRERHIYYGILFAQLADCATITVKRARKHPGHFRINRQFLLAKRASTDGPSWHFTFSPSEIDTLKVDRLEAGTVSAKAYVALICGTEKICLLRQREWGKLLDTRAVNRCDQTVRVKQRRNCQLEVTSSHGTLNHKIPANRFPQLLTSSA